MLPDDNQQQDNAQPQQPVTPDVSAPQQTPPAEPTPADNGGDSPVNPMAGQDTPPADQTPPAPTTGDEGMGQPTSTPGADTPTQPEAPQQPADDDNQPAGSGLPQ